MWMFALTTRWAAQDKYPLHKTSKGLEVMARIISDNWNRYPIWDEWLKTTRFLETAIIAFRSEIAKWNNITISDPDRVVLLRNRDDNKSFRLNQPLYIEALKNETFLYALVLQYSCGLVEQHAKNVILTIPASRLPVNLLDIAGNTDETKIDDFLKGGIETWGTNVLQICQRQWSDVKGGKKGLVEISIVRNALTHGNTLITERMTNRAIASGLTLPWSLGNSIELSYTLLEDYRARLRSFARVLATGAVAP